MSERHMLVAPLGLVSIVSRAFLPACCLALFLLGASPLLPTPSFARGPASVADIAEGLQDAVVNISTTQTLKGSNEDTSTGPGSKGSPFEEFFDDFFDDQDKQGLPRKVSSLGSGFVIDPSGIDRHQQPRHRGRRRDPRQLHRRQQAEGHQDCRVTIPRPISLCSRSSRRSRCMP